MLSSRVIYKSREALPAVPALRFVVGYSCPCIISLNTFQKYSTLNKWAPFARRLSSSTVKSQSVSDSQNRFGFKTWSIYRKVEEAVFSFGFGLLRTLSGQGDKMHSEKCVIEFPNVKIIGIPALADNFMYLVIEKSSLQAVVFDPVEPDNVMNEVRKENVTLTAILTTHHHWDHAGGNEEMVKKYKNEVPNAALDVYGGDERIQALNKKVGQDDKIQLGSLTFHCHFTPCHTSGHICYFLESQDVNIQKPAVFTGDTLFIAGCGRFFEGTAAQMHSALIEKLGTLPSETLVFCGHEYTVNNLKFGLSVEPKNATMQQKLVWAEEQRSKRLPTIPSSIGEEKDINPFMRCVVAEVQKTANASSAVDCMGKLRNMKDNFKAT